MSTTETTAIMAINQRIDELPECDGLVGRLRDICRGKSGLPRWKEDETRKVLWGLPPLPSLEPRQPPQQNATEKPAARITADWDPSQPSRGLGDVIAKVTHATGIDKVVERVTGGGCGCKKRQAALNGLIPFGVSNES